MVTASEKPSAEDGPDDDSDPPDCRLCHGAFSVEFGFERSAHGYCWPCASAMLDRLYDALRTLAGWDGLGDERGEGGLAGKLLALEVPTDCPACDGRRIVEVPGGDSYCARCHGLGLVEELELPRG